MVPVSSPPMTDAPARDAAEGGVDRALAAIGRLLDHRWFPVLLVVAAALVGLATKAFVYPDLSWNRDEPVYLWQADLLTEGKLTTTDGGYPAQFQPWLSAHHDGRFFSQYPLAWPAVIAGGLLVGRPELALAFAAALAVLGTWAFALEVTGSRRRAGATALLLLASPILVVQSGVYLNYLFATGLGLLFAAALLRSARTGSGRLAAAAGALLGLILMTRTFDTVVWSVAVGGFVLVRGRDRLRELARLAPPFLAALLPIVALQLLHNWWTTGSPTTFGITAADPLDKFGFGDRRMMPRVDPFDYTPLAAARSTAKHLFFVPWFLFGAYLGLAAAAYGAWARRREPGTRLLVLLCAAFPLGYLPFWGTHISSLTTRVSGPIYYVPIYAPLCLLAVLGAAELRRRPRVLGVGLVAALALTVPIGIGRLGVNRQLGRIQTAWGDATDRIDGPAVVVSSPSPYLLFLDPGSLTRPDREQELIYATDVDPGLIDLIETSGRPAYLVRAAVPVGLIAPSEHTRPFDVVVEPMTITTGAAPVLDVTTTPEADGVLTVEVAVDGEDRWSAAPVEVAAGEPVTTPIRLGGPDRPDGITLRDGGAVVDVAVGVGPDAATARRSPLAQYRFLVQGGDRVKVLSPGRWYRPDPYLMEDTGRLHWLEDVARGDVTVAVRAGGRGS